MTVNSNVSSNAFNYPDFVKSSVDPRTGQYTASIDLPELKANALSGPDLPLKLDFSPLNLDDSGFGIGWTLRLTQYRIATSLLSLHTGESFKVTGSGSEPAIKEKKLDSFRFFQDDTDTWRVVHRDGTVEILKAGGSQDQRIALPHTLYAASGHRIDLSYASFNGGQRLASIADAHGELLRILRSDYDVKVLLPPFDDQPLSRYVMKLTGSRVMEIVMPVPEQASWRFAYDVVRGTTCITEVKTPQGARETIEYHDEGHPFPGNQTRLNLPRVTRHLIDPGDGRDAMDARYTYSTENFLGNGASISWEDNGLDQLYNVTHTYEYSSTVQHLLDDKVLRTVQRTYNRFHLQIEELITQGQCIKRVVNTFHAIDAPFDRQPSIYQCPRSVENRWELGNDPTQVHSETELSEFDEHGNITLEVKANGISKRTLYYDKDGEDGCPADPNGFVRHVKESIVTPAADARGDAPILVTRYRYSTLAPLDGTPLADWLMVSEESLFEHRDGEETLLHHNLRTFYETPDDPQLHGRPRQRISSLNGTSSTLDFTYGKTRDALLAEDSLQSTEAFTGFDGIRKTTTGQRSLVHGEPLISQDDNDVRVLLSYDSLRRVVKETVAPDTPFTASRAYAYALVATDNQRASKTVTSVKGVETRTHYDGVGHVVLVEQKAEGVWRRIYSAEYDGMARLQEDSRHDWLDGRELSMTTRYAYDDWGQRCRVSGPDGVVQVSETTPFGDGGRLQRSWRESADATASISLLTVTQYNRFDKIDWVERRDDQDRVIGRQVYFYDGFGQCIRNDEELVGETRSTHFEYDARGRMARTRLADDTLVERSFAAHSPGELATAIQVTPGNSADPTVVVGEQAFDGLLRLARLSVGSRVEHYEYEGQKMRLSRRITPANHVIEYSYEADLSDQPKRIIAPDSTATYRFDPFDGGISQASNGAGDREYHYDALGHLELERWVDADGSRHETRHRTSLLGLALQRTDNAIETNYEYDAIGRVERMTQARLQADFEYDTAGRQHRTITRDLDSGDSLVSENTYDSLDRILQRTLLLNDSPARTITHDWSDDDQLLSRHLQMEGRSLLLEEFIYDVRGRLEQHNCSGERLPTDRHGNAISEQLFRFDALSNIRQCLTSFANGETDRARYDYADDDSCQLIEVTHSWTEGGYPASQAFEYDADGNLLNDELGQRLHYDSLGRLLKVTSADASKTHASYRYDGHQHLVGARVDGGTETLRFYQGFEVSHTVQGGVQVQYLRHAGRPLGQQRLDDHERTLLLLTDASPSVIGESLAAGLREVAYSAYGERADEQRLESLMAFNGEVSEPGTGWYLLGRGYRAYNPSLMRFHSPDSFSPFGEGGLNPYLYCLGNPVRFHDPSGHIARRPERDDPIYIDPPEEPTRKKGWMDWMPVIVAVIALVVAVALAQPWAATLTVGYIVGMAGVTAAAAGVAVATVGVLTDSPELQNIAYILSTVGGIAAGGGKFFKPKVKATPPVGGPGVASAAPKGGRGSTAGLDNNNAPGALNTRQPPAPPTSASAIRAGQTEVPPTPAMKRTTPSPEASTPLQQVPVSQTPAAPKTGLPDIVSDGMKKQHPSSLRAPFMTLWATSGVA